MDLLKSILDWIDGSLGGSPWFPWLLLGTGIFFTIYLKFPQFRYLGHAFRIVRGKFDRKDDEGDTSHFQALTTALSGTVGTGNIGGVALAIHLGGPAALFWMLVTALLGMTTKFVEVTLSHKYREKAEDGSIAGGPMYYMKNRLKLPWLAAIFAVATVLSSFGTGNMPQINNIAQSVQTTFEIEPWITGAVLSVILALVIIGGIKRIAAVTEKLVPGMALLYFIGAFAVIFFNADNIIPSLISIFDSIFSGSAATGGFLGATFAYVFNRGVNRGLFSNEAGQGSAPIAHAAARAHEPVSEGMVAILEPFIDTIIICTITGMVLLSSGAWNEKFDNVFQYTELSLLNGNYDEANEDSKKVLYHLLNDHETRAIEKAVETNTHTNFIYSGSLKVEEGSVSKDVHFIKDGNVVNSPKFRTGNSPFSGELMVENGKVTNSDLSTKKGDPVTDLLILENIRFTGFLSVKEGKVVKGYYKELEKTDSAIVFDGSVNADSITNIYEAGRSNEDLTIVHSRSVSENVLVERSKGGDLMAEFVPFSGLVPVDGGKLAILNDSNFRVTGKSLLHSAPLTTEAFKKSYFGDYGKYIVTLGLLLFAFSTALSWSYYGDRAMTYLFGSKSVIFYRIAYVGGFFIAAISDTSIVWTVANITIVLMTIPNLIGIIFLHKEVKQTISQYWDDFKKDWPDQKTPE